MDFNNQAIFKIIASIIGSILTSGLIYWLYSSGKNAKKRKEGNKKILYWPTPWYAMAALGMFFFGGLMIWAVLAPGPTSLDGIILACCVFGVFFLMSMLTLIYLPRSVGYWNEQTIQGANWYGAQHTLRWEHIVACDYRGWAQAIILKDKQGKTIWVYEQMSGYDELVFFLEEQRKLPDLR